MRHCLIDKTVESLLKKIGLWIYKTMQFIYKNGTKSPQGSISIGLIASMQTAELYKLIF